MREWKIKKDRKKDDYKKIVSVLATGRKISNVNKGKSAVWVEIAELALRSSNCQLESTQLEPIIT